MATEDRNGKLHDENNGQFVGNRKKASSKVSLNFFSEKGLKDQKPKSLKRGIRSINKKIELHRLKIQYPDRFSSDWEGLSDELKQRRIEYWEKEIKAQTNAVQERIDYLKRLGEDYDK